MKYTIVDEGYDVDIFTKKELINYLKKLFISDSFYLKQDNQGLCTVQCINNLLLKLENFESVWLYEPDSLEWKYKIQGHHNGK